jgi:type IV pilus assembly protein PilY1
MTDRITRTWHLLLAAAACCSSGPAHAVQVEDDMTQPAALLNWASFNGACLTAGNNTGTIPACRGLPYYQGDPNALSGGTSGKLPDAAGQGALRFTDWYAQNGAVVSNFTFPSNQGLNVVFTTVTYQGDSGGGGKDGADGISFFLMDGAQAPGLGAWGGSLAYTCSNVNSPHDGLIGAYLGLGMDEYGNFLNQGDNTASGWGYQPGRIGLRGAGNIAWSWLNANYPQYYPSSLSTAQRQAAVTATCASGHLYNYATGGQQLSTTVLDYPAIPNGAKLLSASTPIAVENAVTRSQGMPITYNLQVTQDGLLSLAFSYNGGAYQPVLTNQSIAASNGPMPANLRFGFAGSTGGSRNIHEITCFKASPAQQADSSAGVNTQQAETIQTGTQVYLAYFHSNNWWGQLTSQNLLFNGATNTVSISPAVNWDASCVLTGGACASTGATSGIAQGPGSRQILTFDGTNGIAFEWTSLSSSLQNALDAGDATPYNATRLNYLRGDRSNERTPSGSGIYRARTSVLADIQGSSPAWEGPPTGPYGAVWTDNLYPSATPGENAKTALTYPAFASVMATRTNVVYAGANDGMLHGFRSGAYDGQVSTTNPLGNYIAAGNDGQEVIAYLPGAVLQSIHSTTATIDYSSTQYAHAFDVNATPAIGDLFYNGAWHTWLVGGLGAGGNAIYALDVTNPSNFSESNAAGLVIGEWTSSSLTCVNSSTCKTSLGNTFGTPTIRRFHNGSWGFVFGNGLNSSTGHAGVYIATVSPGGTVLIYFLDTGYGPKQDPTGTGRPDGIAYATPADLDGDHVVDYIYAGDVFGNVWRFDVTSSNPASWSVTNGTPLFSTPSNQPITTQLLVASTSATMGSNRVMVVFGTGQEIPMTTTSATAYASGPQALYGIWDWNMAGWNSLSKVVNYASLTGSYSISTGSLQTQIISTLSAGSATAPGTRAITQTAVCWQGSTACSSGNTQFGWQANLPASSEQVIYSPILYNGAVLFNTTVPANNSPFACSADLPTGWTMAMTPSAGAGFTNSFFGPSEGPNVSGLGLNATGAPSVVLAQGRPYVVSQTVSGTGTVNSINPPGGTQGARITWTMLR